MLPEKVLLVDANALCYAAYYTSGNLSYKGSDTGIIYGFFNQIAHMSEVLQVAHFAFCWDSRQSHRKRLFPEYKSNRKKDDPQLLRALQQFKTLRKEILPNLGFANNFHINGYESDDLLAVLSLFGIQSGQMGIIASSDQDLYQLLSPYISMYRINKKRLYTEADFIREYNIHPRFWVDVKCLAGCQSDAVPGIPGIGEKRALDYLKSRENLKNPKIDTPEGKEIRRRNRPLVELPFQGTPKLDLHWDKGPDFAAWFALCEDLGFESFLKQSHTWEAIFSGKAPQAYAMSKIRITRPRKD